MKKLISIILLAAMLFTSASCGILKKTEGDETTGTGDTTEIVIREPKLTGTVGTSEDYEVSSLLFNYFFFSNYNQYISNYSSYLSYIGLDTSKSLKEQQYSETETWFDYFTEYAKYQISQLIALSTDAKKKGVTLTDELQTQLEETVDSIPEYASSYDMEVTEYLETVFCKGMTVDIVREAIELQMIAQLQYNSIYDALEVTNEDLNKYVDENQAEYYNIGYIWYTFAAETDDDGKLVDGALEKAYQNAEALAALGSVEAIKTAVENNFREKYQASGSYDTEIALDNAVNSAMNNAVCYGLADTGDVADDWLLSDERQIGDTYIYTEDDDYGYTVFVFTDAKELDTTRAIDVRHILFTTETYGDEAKAKAEEALENWKNGEATEDSFAALANDLSEDPSSNTTGGIYTGVLPGQMVATFNDWCFDESRKAGDTGIVETSYGYHVMYFSARAEKAQWEEDAESDLRSDSTYDAVLELEEQYAITYIEDFSDYIDC